MTFDEFRNRILYHKVVSWNGNTITLDDGLTIAIEEPEQDCCASASGRFTAVTLDAAITDVTEPHYTHWEDYDTYGCTAVVKMLHNQNLICQAEADADAGNGGYYYSIASFVITVPNSKKTEYVHFVGSDDK